MKIMIAAFGRNNHRSVEAVSDSPKSIESLRSKAAALRRAGLYLEARDYEWRASQMHRRITRPAFEKSEVVRRKTMDISAFPTIKERQASIEARRKEQERIRKEARKSALDALVHTSRSAAWDCFQKKGIFA